MRKRRLIRNYSDNVAGDVVQFTGRQLAEFDIVINARGEERMIPRRLLAPLWGRRSVLRFLSITIAGIAVGGADYSEPRWLLTDSAVADLAAIRRTNIGRNSPGTGIRLCYSGDDDAERSRGPCRCGRCNSQ